MILFNLYLEMMIFMRGHLTFNQIFYTSLLHYYQNSIFNQKLTQNNFFLAIFITYILKSKCFIFPVSANTHKITFFRIKNHEIFIEPISYYFKIFSMCIFNFINTFPILNRLLPSA